MGTIEAIVCGTLYALIANILVLRLHLLLYFILLLPRKGGIPGLQFQIHIIYSTQHVTIPTCKRPIL